MQNIDQQEQNKMQNQNNLTQLEQIRVLFEQQCKTHLIVVYISCIGVAVFSVLGIMSSQKLQNDYSYYSGIQTAIIVFCSLTLLSLLFLIYAMASKTTQYSAKIVSQILFCIPLAGALGVILASILISAFTIYCGYYIGHDDGSVDGSYIKISFQTDSKYPSCQSMENNNLSVRDQILAYSVIILIDYCSLMSKDIQSCASLNSLVVEDWSIMFSLQLAALIGLGVLYIVMGVVFTLLRKKYKNIQDQLKKSALVQTPFYQNGQYQQQLQQQVIPLSDTNQFAKPQQQLYQQQLYQVPQQPQSINHNY